MTEDSQVISEKTEPKVITGQMAEVTIHEDTVDLKPTPGTTKGHLNEKMTNQAIFNGVVENIQGIDQPRITRADTTNAEYTVERCKGFSLYGTDVIDKAFLRIPPKEKVKMMLTYVQAIEKLHESGYLFNDHKPDSIYINQKGSARDREYTISIIDAGSIIKTKDVMDTGTTKNTDADLLQEMRNDDNFRKTLASFFTQGRNDEKAEFLIPTGIQDILDRLSRKEFTTAIELKREIGKYMNGQNTYGRDTSDPTNKLENTARQLGVLSAPGVSGLLRDFDSDPHRDKAITQDMLEAKLWAKRFANEDRFAR